LIAAVIIILLVVAGGAFLFWNFMQGAGPAPEPAVTPTATPTPTITLAPATIATTAPPVTTAVPTPVPVLIPPDGVWVRVNYSGSFKGSIGTAADQRPVADSGDQFYSVPTSEGIVQLAVQKIDGSGKELVVEVYRNGVLIKRGATTVPRGVVELQVDLRPPKTTAIPTTLPTTVAATQAANMTVANTTGSNTTATTTTVPPSST
jgi:hypothetical protein